MPLDSTTHSPTAGHYELDTRTGIMIQPKRDHRFSEFAFTLLTEKYLRPGETPQLGHARAARAWCGGDLDLAQRLYDYASQGWFMWASPVLANAPLPGERVKGMPISCYLNHVGDSLEEIISHSTETRWLAVLGGGVGGHWQIRAASDKSPGAIPFIKTLDGDMEAYRQGKTRRGSYAAYLDISHPDVREFLALRIEGSGDESRKCHSPGFNHGLNITDAFMEAVDADAPWNLVDPHDGSVREVVRARELWQEIMETRNRSGEPYLFFIDAARRALPPSQRALGLNIYGSNLCSEITLATSRERTAVCCLSSLNAEYYPQWQRTSIVADLITMLDNVLQHFIDHAPVVLSKAVFSAMRERALGLGVMGVHSLFQSKMIPFESDAARELNVEMISYVQACARAQSYVLGGVRGEAPDMAGTGLRNSHLIALAPNANSAILLDTSPATEPWAANAFVQETRIGTKPVKNRYLDALLTAKGQNTSEVWTSIVLNKGSVAHLEFLTDAERQVFRTADEINQMWVVKHAADRQPFVCQAQSINVFFPARSDKEHISLVHMTAWRLGLKSLYYMRTKSKNRAESVSEKKVRVALVDHVEQPEEECLSCHG